MNQSIPSEQISAKKLVKITSQINVKMHTPDFWYFWRQCINLYFAEKYLPLSNFDVKVLTYIFT